MTNKYWRVGEEHPDWVDYLIEDGMLVDYSTISDGLKLCYRFRYNTENRQGVFLFDGDGLVYTTDGIIAVMYEWWVEHRTKSNEE